MLLIVYPSGIDKNDTIVCDHSSSFLIEGVLLPGMAWSGSGITDSDSGRFDASMALIDTNTIYLNNNNRCFR